MKIIDSVFFTTTYRQANAAVAKGAALLDQRRPGWEHDINLGRLDISFGSTCILGQLYGTFENGLAKVFVGFSLTAEPAFEHGFIGWTLTQDAILTRAWRREILRRRTSALPEAA